MTASKSSFVSAISLIEESYNYLVGDTSEYPKAYIDEIKEIGDVYLEGAKLLKTAMQNGGVFYVPKYFAVEDKWPTTAANSWMQIDFGKFFQAGYLSNIIDRNTEGKVALYIYASKYEDCYDEETDNYHRKLIDDFAIPFTSFDTVEDDIQAEFENLGISDEDAEDYYVSLALKLDAKLVDDLVGHTFMEDMFYDYTDELYIEIF